MGRPSCNGFTHGAGDLHRRGAGCRPRYAIVAALGVLGLGGGCFMPREAGEHLQTEMLALRHDLGTLERRLADTQAVQNEQTLALKTQVDKLNKDAASLSHSTRLADADIGAQLERMVQDVQQLRGAIEVNAHQLGEAQSQQSRVTQDLTAKLAALQASAAQARERTSASASRKMPTGKLDLLRYGLKLIALPASRDDGRGALRDVARKYRRERGVADEALFALGSSYLDEKNHKAAMADLITLVEEVPGSPRQADAFYKLGLCSEQLGHQEDAVTFYNEVAHNHRKSPVFAAAKARLAALAQVSGTAAKPSPAP